MNIIHSLRSTAARLFVIFALSITGFAATAVPLQSGMLLDPQFQTCLDKAALANGWTSTEEVTSLTCSASNIENLDGIQLFTDLIALDVSENHIFSTYPLDMLTQLQVLDLSNNQLGDVTSLQMLHNLKQLNLSNNQGTNQPYPMPPIDLQVVNQIIQANPGITHLGIAGITIGDLIQLAIWGTPLETGLIELDISNTDVSDISRVLFASNLRTLKASGNTIQDVGWIDQLQQLEVLDLSNNQLGDVTSLQMLNTLKQLNLSNNQSANQPYYMPPIDLLAVNQIIQANPGITHLGIAGITIGDLNQLVIFGTPQESGLIELDISNTGVSDISRLSSATNLRQLKASGNAIHDVGWIDQLQQLDVLDLSNNQLGDVASLQMLHKLKQLNLSNNQVVNQPYYYTPPIDLLTVNQIILANPGITHLGIAGITIGDLNQLAIFGTPQVPGLIELDISNTGVTTLSPLFYATNLRVLKAGNNSIYDLNGIESMLYLQVLDLSNNQLGDLYPLRMLQKLSQINLSNNKPSDIYSSTIDVMAVNQVLQANPGITHLGIAGVTIDDLNQLAIFGIPQETGLIELDISHTGVSDISRLSSIVNLRTLKASGNTIQDIWWIELLEQLEVLDLSNNQLGDVTSLQMLHKLKQLNLSNNQAASLPYPMPPIDLLAVNQIIQANSGITHLGIAGVTIGDLNQLAIFGTPQAVGLIEFDISNTGVSDISLLSAATKLRTLKASGNAIQDIWWMDQLQQLEVLDLSNNQLADVNSLQMLHKLKQLNLSSNQAANQPYYMPSIDLLAVNQITQANLGITHLGIAGVNIGDLYQLDIFSTGQALGLIELDISNTGISDISLLSSSTKLRLLKASGNVIQDVWWIDQLPQLEVLDLSHNQLGNMSSLQLLRKLKQLNLSNNQPANQPYPIPPIDLWTVNQILQANLGITHLGIAGITIGDLNQLAIFGTPLETGLIELDISHTGVSDISRLSTVVNLRTLKASGNAILSTGSIDQLQQLEVLDLSHNQLGDVYFLQMLHTLKQLNLSNNRVVNQPYNTLPPIDLAIVNLILQANPGITHLGIEGVTIGDLSQLVIFGTPQEFGLIELDISHTGVSDISRLSSATKLRLLKASGNAIQDIWWMDQLQQLEVLDLSHNQLGDVSSLQMLHKLKQLNLSNNQAASLPYPTPPIDLLAVNQIIQVNPGITHLGIAGVTIGDLNQLAIFGTPQAVGLIEFDISNTGVSDISLLSAATKLRLLKASGNAIQDVWWIDQLQQLELLDLSNNQLADVTSLQMLHKLKQLNLSNNQVVNQPYYYTSPIDLMAVNQIIQVNPGITHLSIAGAEIGDLNQLAIFGTPLETGLIELDISHTGVSDISRLSSVVNLRLLKASGNAIQDIWWIDQLQQLEVLDLSNNQLGDVYFLQMLHTLKQLNLSNNQVVNQPYNYTRPIDLLTVNQIIQANPGITHLGIAGVTIGDLNQLAIFGIPLETGLIELDISNTGIIALSPLLNATSLRVLKAGENSILDLHGVESMLSLQVLDLSNNQLSDLSKLQMLHNLEQLDLSNNQPFDLFMLNQVLVANPRITHLGIAGTAIGDLNQLSIFGTPQAAGLVELDISNTGISDMSLLSPATKLRILKASGNAIQDIVWIDQLQQLEVLDLSKNQLSDVASLQMLQQLKRLNLSNNQSASLPYPMPPIDLMIVNQIIMSNPGLTHLGLAGIHIGLLDQLDIFANGISNNIVELDVSHSGIQNLNAVNAMTGLRVLKASGNLISDIYPLSALLQLEVLDLSNNEIQFVLPLGDLLNLDLLDLRGNNKIQCAELDQLETMLQAGVLIRPATCIIMSPPTVMIHQPYDGMSFYATDLVDFMADASDPEDGDLTQNVQWSSSLSGLIGTGAIITPLLSAGEQVITASVTDSHGNVSSTSINISVFPNTLPEILIYSVMDGAVFNEGEDVYISASANDLEDGDISYNLQWSSDIDGFLGYGWIMIARLSAGNHIITATVMDYAGASSTQSVSITINALPQLTLITPMDQSVFNQGESISFSASANDVEDGVLDANILWSSDHEGLFASAGGQLTQSLTFPGPHLITASITDSYGATTTQSIFVIVNELPVVTIQNPLDGALIQQGDVVSLLADAHDLEDFTGTLATQIIWSSNLDGVLGTGMQLHPVLSEGIHTITASITDTNGATTTQSVTVNVNGQPQLTIQSPLDGSVYQQGDSVTLSAIANDTEEGDLTANIEWTSNIQGLLGSGASLTQVLSVGTHYIAADVRDSNGGFTLKTVTIAVNGLPQLDLVSPLNASLYQEGDIVNFSASAFDAEDGDLDTSINWISNLQGNIGTGAQLTEVLSVGHHIVTASITDSAGVTVTQTTAVTVNSQPIVSITSPVSGALFMLQESVNLSATANDLEDGVISAAIEWSSNLDGLLGSGASLTRNLSLGTHTITASITDSAGGVFTTGTQLVIDQIDLSVTVSGNGSRKYATLTWSGSRAAVDVYKNGLLRRAAFVGDSTVFRFKNQATFKVCETATNNCSVEVVAVAQ